MQEEWTGNLIGTMHNNEITYDELAQEMGISKSYISKILNGKRKPLNIQENMQDAVDSIIQRKRGKKHVSVSQQN